MINFKDRTVLVIAPHPDDEVFGCGGLIHKCKKQGGKVYVLYLTVGSTQDFSENGLSTKSERIKEIEKVAKYLKFDGYRIAFPGNKYHLKLDALPQKEIIDEIERGEGISLQALKPSIIVTPLANDYNQDHRAGCSAAVTATRPAPSTFKHPLRFVLQYELPSNSWTDRDTATVLNCFMEMGKEDMDAKIQATQLYKSQLKHPEAPLSVHGVETLAHMRGLQSGSNYAEAFFAKRILM